MKFVNKFRKSPQEKQIAALYKEWDKTTRGRIILRLFTRQRDRRYFCPSS